MNTSSQRKARPKVYILAIFCVAGIVAVLSFWIFARQLQLCYFSHVASQEERNNFAQSLLSRPSADAPAECLSFDWSRIDPEKITTHRGKWISWNLVLIEGIRDDGFRVYYLVMQHGLNGKWKIYKVWSSIHG